jgi:ribose-phosphate pyrophosphokinase
MIRFKAIEPNGSLIKSAITPFTFPAGEAHVKYEERRELEPTEVAILTPSPDSIHTDLFHLAMWNDHIARYDGYDYGKTQKVLLIPYFPGARADRGTPFGLAVYVSFIKQLDLDHVGIFDPHSEVLEKALVADSILYPHDILPGAHLPSYDGIIAPDAGARTRAGNVADALGLPLHTAEKTRNYHTGKLSGYRAPEDIVPAGNYLVVDDICDGGGTFWLLANALKEWGVSLDLYVSHGVFSGNAPGSLLDLYRRVFTTNSYVSENRIEAKDRMHIHFLDVIGPMLAQIKTKAPTP